MKTQVTSQRNYNNSILLPQTQQGVRNQRLGETTAANSNNGTGFNRDIPSMDLKKNSVDRVMLNQ
jgi:hypothetical protein